jgi:hypothetical protein
MGKGRILLVAFILGAVTLPSSYAGPYIAKFIGNPVEYSAAPGVPGIKATVSFGPIESYLDYPVWCWPPPPFFGVAVDWRSPNDPDCWFNVFLALEAYGVGPNYIVYRGNGRIILLNGFPRDMTCWWPLRCGYNKFSIEVWPLVSGEYRFRLISFDFYRWPDDCLEYKPFYTWSYSRPFISDETMFKIHEQANDFIYFSHLYYYQPDRCDTTFDGGALHVMSDYRIYTKIVTTRQEETLPQTLTGYLRPEGSIIQQQVDFHRWPDGDEGPPCDPTFPVRIYAYESDDLITPYDLWNYTPDQWKEICKELNLILYGDQNEVGNDIENTVYVMSMITLDCLNDSTVCFVPVAGEQMGFLLRYCDALDPGPETEMTFKVVDRFDDLVYSILLPPGEFQSEPNDFGLPVQFNFRQIPIVWDGRNNQDPLDPGHCADPDLSSYKAHVFVDDPGGDITSNIESFDVVPKIDSVLVTHHPFYPPTEEDPTTVFAVMKGKIDDSQVPEMNYRYYIPMADYPGQNPDFLDFWENEWLNENYMFWDADYHDDLHRKFYENNNAQTIGLTEWNQLKLGRLDYRWLVIKDQRIGQTNQVSYENVVDTTDYIEDFWKIDFTRPVNWSEPGTWPYMRLLLYPEIRNAKNGYYVQSRAAVDGPDAHKVIFMFDWWRTPEIDLADWATSHIGVPYVWDMYQKIPYMSNDCASLVTASRIEQLGPGVGDYLSIAHIYSYVYYRGYLDPTHPEIRFTEIVEDPRTDPDLGPGYRGLLLFIHKRGDNSPEWIDSRHIAVIYYLRLDDRAIPTYCRIVHGKGGYHSQGQGRTRYDNALDPRLYPPYYDMDGYRDNEWVWTFIKFTE